MMNPCEVWNSPRTETTHVYALKNISPMENHPFGVRDDEEMEALVESIRQYGVLNPIIVRERRQYGDNYEIVSGHRRYEACKRLGKFDIPVMVIHPFIGFKDHTPTQVGLDNYARVIEVANKLNVKLGFENVEGEEYIAAIMKTFWNEPSVGFCLDTGHEMCYNEHRDMLALYGEKLCHTHLNDNLGVRGDEITFHDDLHLMPTDGIADWHNIMERIRKTGYNGYLMSELSRGNKIGKNGEALNYGELSTEQFHAIAIEKIKKAISM